MSPCEIKDRLHPSNTRWHAWGKSKGRSDQSKTKAQRGTQQTLLPLHAHSFSGNPVRTILAPEFSLSPVPPALPSGAHVATLLGWLHSGLIACLSRWPWHVLGMPPPPGLCTVNKPLPQQHSNSSLGPPLREYDPAACHPLLLSPSGFTDP